MIFREVISGNSVIHEGEGESHICTELGLHLLSPPGFSHKIHQPPVAPVEFTYAFFQCNASSNNIDSTHLKREHP